jgi:hypothetical protein
MLHVRLAVVLAAVSLSLSCSGNGGGGGGGGGQSAEISFTGELSAFPDYSYDSGWLPDASPVQVKMLFTVEAKLAATANAVVGGSNDAPIMSGKAGSGMYKLDVKLVFQVLVKIDLTGVSYEGPVDENADITFEIGDEISFDPFLLGSMVPIAADVPETKLMELPLAGSIPGVDGNVIIHISGLVNSEFSGTCAAINGSQAHYMGSTATSADLILKPSIAVKIPFVYDETIEVGEIPVAIPAATLALDLGTLDVTPGGGAVDGGGSLATIGTCDGSGGDGDVITGDDVGGGEDVTTGEDITTPDDSVVDDCAATCDGCCLNGECQAGDTVAACGSEGAACKACQDGWECVNGGCIDTSVSDCAADCPGCCAGDACLPGDENYACGTAGDQCVECSPGFACEAGICKSAAYDCAKECAGCCQGSACLPGTINHLCGSDGEACYECTGESVCYAGACVDEPYDCSSECNGCCVGNECLAGSADDACGWGGVECTSCWDDEVCENQVCVDTSGDCWSTCDGCCDNGVCETGFDDWACGSFGTTCQVCDGGLACAGGACSVDPSSYWDVVAIEGEAFILPDGGSWDSWDGLPDLYAEFATFYQEGNGYGLEVTTSVVDDTMHAYWNETVIEDIQAQDLLDEGLSIELLDEDDFNYDDSIGSCSFVIGPSDFDGLPKSGCGSFGDFEVMYKLVPAQ